MTPTQRAPGGRYIHYDPEQVHFAVRDDELKRLAEGSAGLWKDVCLVSLSLGMPCLINAVAGTKLPFEWSLALFLNYLLGVLGIALGIIFGIAWYRGHTSVSTLVASIKSKPRMQITLPTTQDVGALPAAELIAADQNLEEQRRSDCTAAG